MKKRKRIRTLLAAVFIAACALTLLLWPEKAESIKIGAIISLTGPGSHMVDVRDALILAVDEINERGGINGRDVELIVKDSKTDPEEAVKVFNKLESAHQPILCFSTQSAICMALAPLAEKRGVPFVGLVAASPDLTKGKEWVFRYFTSPEYEVAPILFHLKEQGVRNLGILYLNDPYGVPVFERLREGFQKTGGTVKSASFERKIGSVNEQIENLEDVEAIYAVGYPSHLKKIFETLKEKKHEGVVLGSSGTVNLMSTPAAEGVYSAAAVIYNPNNLFAKRAKEKYEGAYGKPFCHQVASGYDFVKLLTSLLEGREISRGNVKSLLEKGFVYPGIFGEIVLKPGEHDIYFPLYPAQLVDGKVRYRY